MNNNTISPPQPIPYPERGFLRKLVRVPLLLYRLGLKKLFGQHVLILSTTGRKTSHIHRTPVEYFKHKGRIYIISGFGHRPDWLQNLLVNPEVTIQTGDQTTCAIARPPEDDEEWLAVYRYIQESPITNLFMTDYLEALSQADALDQVKKWDAITFDPTDGPCPPPLEEDLLWAWPLILILLALDILTGWLILRSK